jgi:hypothetical protein
VKKWILMVASVILFVLLLGCFWFSKKHKYSDEEISEAIIYEKTKEIPKSLGTEDKNLVNEVKVIDHELKKYDKDIVISGHVQNCSDKKLSFFVTCYFLDKSGNPFKESFSYCQDVKPNYIDKFIFLEKKEDLPIWDGTYKIETTKCY